MESPRQQQFLPPPPPEVPPNVVPMKVEPAKRRSVSEIVKPQVSSVMSHRPSSKGKRVSLLTNHFKVTISTAVDDFYHYDVLITYEDGSEIKKKNIKRAVVDKLCEVYKSELAGKSLVFDGVQSLYSHGPLPQNNLQFSVMLNSISAEGLSSNGSLSEHNDQKRQKIASLSKIFKVEMKFVSQISIQSLYDPKCGTRLKDERSLRVLNTILQQQASKQGCLVIRQSFFQNEPGNFIDLGGGIHGCRGFFSSFKALNGGLYLNHDVSMTTVIQAGPVIDFLINHQNAKTPFKIDWSKAIETLKNLRFKVKHLNSEFKITGLSARSCKEQKFSIKLGETSLMRSIETTVYDYFVSTRGIELSFSANLPCINAGKPNNPIFFPIEICYLVPLQRYKNELTSYQRFSMITKSIQKPEDLVKILAGAGKRIKPEAEPLLQSCGVSINSSLVQADGRVLTAPRLKMGNEEHIFPRNAWWNIKDKKFLEAKGLQHWAIVNFSTSCDVSKMCGELAKISSSKGMAINPPLCVLQENPKNKKKPPFVRVEMMFQQVQSKFQKNPPQFLLCLLSDKKCSDLYGPWKRKTIIEFGIRDQCISCNKIDDHYLMNLLLKINVKLGGFNHTVVSELTRSIPLVSKIPTMIFGMEVSQTSPGRTDSPSIASVVGSRGWPRISSYRASVRALPPKAQMIDSLFKPLSQQEDTGMIRELLLEFYASSGQKKPAHIIIFRNGLHTSQFNQFLDVEMDQMLKACNFLEDKWRPKFTVIFSQRRHHTKFFDANSGANIPPGTVVDNKVIDLRYTNFYISAHASRKGTSRPTHCHVLLDEIGFSADDLQELIHSLSYVFQRSNNAISEVAPVRYARLAAAKISQLTKSDKMRNATESRGEYFAGYQLPKLHKNVSSSMFFI